MRLYPAGRCLQRAFTEAPDRYPGPQSINSKTDTLEKITAAMEISELFLHGFVVKDKGYVNSDSTFSKLCRILAARAARHAGRNNAR